VGVLRRIVRRRTGYLCTTVWMLTWGRTSGCAHTRGAVQVSVDACVGQKRGYLHAHAPTTCVQALSLCFLLACSTASTRACRGYSSMRPCAGTPLLLNTLAPVCLYASAPLSPCASRALLPNALALAYLRLAVQGPSACFSVSAATASSPSTRVTPLSPAFTTHRRLVFCSGKVFYELHAEREKQGIDKDNTVALVRLEQVSSEGASKVEGGGGCGKKWAPLVTRHALLLCVRTPSA